MHPFTLSAFGDEISPELSVQMDVLERFGIRHIEMRGVGGKNLVNYTLDEAAEIKRTLDGRGFRLSAMGSPFAKIKISEDFAPHLELFRHALAVAKIMECRFIRMFSFFVPPGEASAYRDEVMRRWRLFVEDAAEADVVLLHENEKNIYGDTAERCRDLLATIGSDRVRATFDPANFVQCGEEPFPAAFSTLREYIAQMHVKDARFADRKVVPPGMGDGRVEDTLRSLSRAGFEGVLSIEPHLASYPDTAAFENDERVAQMPAGGPRQFAVAAVTLLRILERI